jgi:lipopolysaccharide export system protein LptA
MTPRPVPSPSSLRAFGAALSLVLLCAAPAAHALDKDKDQPLNVDADRFEGGLKQDLSVLTGNVRITQGSIVGTGARADIHQKASAVTRVVLTGTPATFQQDIEGGGTMKGRAQSIDYDPDAKHAVLSGDAVVEHPDGEARGARLTYDVDTGKMSGDGQGGDGRVHLRMAPKAKDSGADKKKSDKDGAKGVEKKPDGSAEKGAAAAASPGAPAQPS